MENSNNNENTWFSEWEPTFEYQTKGREWESTPTK